MTAGDRVEVRVTHVRGSAAWMDARLLSVDARRDLARVELTDAPVRFCVALRNVRVAS